MSSNVPFENLEPLLPIDFFRVSLELLYAKEIPKKWLFDSKYQLPSLCDYLSEQHFADCSLAWNEEGIIGEVLVHKAFENSSFPNYHEGDSLEIFIDTRDLKKAGFATKFCHHFIFLASAVQDIQVQEVSRFRSEDAHELCDSSQINVDVEYRKKEYIIRFFIPSSCLVGYDPQVFPRLGFTYKINRHKGAAQHFSVSSSYFDIMQNPSLWSSLKLVKS